jgi:hypothetical protein
MAQAIMTVTTGPGGDADAGHSPRSLSPGYHAGIGPAGRNQEAIT